MNKKNTTIVIALAMMLTLTFGLYGQNTEDDNSPFLFPRNNSIDGNGIVGTWVAEVTIRNCQTNDVIRTVQALNTFNLGGTMMEAGNSLTRGPGHGTWERTRGNNYRSVFMFFRFNPDGTYAGFQKVRRHHTLSFGGRTLTTTATFEIFNADGIRIATPCATETAVRLDD